MNDAVFTPVLYSKEGCPFSFKVRLFLLEAGLLDRVEVVQGATPEEHQEVADMLAERLGKASFPTAEIEPGTLMTESDALIAHFAKVANVDPAELPTYQAYAGSIFPLIMRLYKENAELKSALF